MQNKKYKGITRNKTDSFIQNKEARRKKTTRFAKQNLSGLSELYSPTTPSQLKNPLTIELSKMPTMSTLPPEWVQKYDECLSIIKNLDDIKKQILTEQSRRLGLIKVSEEKESQRKIYELTTTATKKIKQCEKILQAIKKQEPEESQSQKKSIFQFNEARNSACVSLALVIQEKTKQLRGQQKAFIQHRQNLQQSTRVSFLELAAQKAYDGDYYDEELQNEEQSALEFKVSQQRNQQILKIVQSVHELNDLYKQLNNLVIVQGSLLDRIDYNINQSAVLVKKGQETLTRVDQRQKKSKCACIMISIMVVAMLILGIILIVKWSH